jgi:hypothetical protein
MAKVTYSSAKGLVVGTGTGFQVNDAPILEEIEDVTTSAVSSDGAGYGVTRVTTGATEGVEALDLDDGDAAGQLKTVVLHAEGNAADTLQVTQNDGDNVGAVLTAAGDFLHLVWTGSTWAEVAEQRT